MRIILGNFTYWEARLLTFLYLNSNNDDFSTNKRKKSKVADVSKLLNLDDFLFSLLRRDPLPFFPSYIIDHLL